MIRLHGKDLSISLITFPLNIPGFPFQYDTKKKGSLSVEKEERNANRCVEERKLRLKYLYFGIWDFFRKTSFSKMFFFFAKRHHLDMLDL